MFPVTVTTSFMSPLTFLIQHYSFFHFYLLYKWMKSNFSRILILNIKFMYIFLEVFSSRPTLSPLSTALKFLLSSVFFLYALNLRHVDLYYEDGSNPPESVLQVISTDTGITHHGYEYYFIKGLKKVKSSEEGERQEIFSLSLSRMLYT